MIFVAFLLYKIINCFEFNSYPEIIGDELFMDKVTEALNLIETMSPETLNFISQYVKRIEQFEKTGMCVYCNPPTYQIAPATYNYGVYWLASTIAHDAYHSYLYHYYKNILGGNEPKYDWWAGFEADRQCNWYQLKVLIKLDAPRHLIDYMMKQDGTHCDINGDGVCDEIDYVLREWRFR